MSRSALARLAPFACPRSRRRRRYGVFAVESLRVGVDTIFRFPLDGVATFSCISLLTPAGKSRSIKMKYIVLSARRPGDANGGDA